MGVLKEQFCQHNQRGRPSFFFQFSLTTFSYPKTSCIQHFDGKLESSKDYSADGKEATQMTQPEGKLRFKFVHSPPLDKFHECE